MTKYSNGQFLRLIKECSITKAYNVPLGTVHSINITDLGLIIIEYNETMLVLRPEQFEPIDDNYNSIRASLKELINEHTLLVQKAKNILSTL